jgi:hypothetical protein
MGGESTVPEVPQVSNLVYPFEHLTVQIYEPMCLPRAVPPPLLCLVDRALLLGVGAAGSGS